MTRVLIMFDTTEGQTRKIAQTIEQQLERSGIATDVYRAGEMEPAIGEYSAIIVAGSVHAGKYQKPLVQWVRNYAPAFGSRPTAFISVSLGVLQKNDVAAVKELDTIVNRFCDHTGWRPGAIKHVAGALLYTRYNFFMRWMMRRIVAKAGGDTDTSKDYEYTDWNDLSVWTEEFRRRLSAAA